MTAGNDDEGRRRLPAVGAGGHPVTTWTVLFTDEVSSTERRVRLGESAFDRVREDVDRLVRGTVAAHTGDVVKSTGDGMMARFASTAAAVQCAVAIQQAMGERNRVAGAEPVALRIGISVGDAVPDEGDLHGTAVVEAARLCAEADPEMILCTDSVRAVSANRSGCAFSGARSVSLKGLPEPIVVHEVVWAPARRAGSDGIAFGVLGAFDVRDSAGAPVAVGGPKERLVLALLLLHPNETVSIDALVDALWGDRPPRTAERTVHAYVARLRKALDPEGRRGRDSTALVTIGRGYRLVVEPAQVDAARFEARAAEGAELLELGDPARAAEAFATALAEWRGAAYGEFAAIETCAAEAARLTELRLFTTEQRVDLDLANGRSAELEQLRTLGGAGLETGGVDLRRLDDEAVAVPDGDESRRLTAPASVRVESPSQPSDVGMDVPFRRARWVLAPQCVDERGRRHRFVRVDQKKGEDELLLVAADGDGSTGAVAHLEPPEHAEGDPVGACGPRRRPHHLVYDDGFGQPLQVDGPGARERAPRSVGRHRPDAVGAEDHVGVGLGTQPRCLDHCGAVQVAVVRDRVAHADADPKGDRLRSLGPVALRHRLLDGDGALHRSGCARETGHHPVTGRLHDLAGVSGDDALDETLDIDADAVERGLPHPDPAFGRRHLVGEQHCPGGHRLSARTHVREPMAAVVVVPSVPSPAHGPRIP